MRIPRSKLSGPNVGEQAGVVRWSAKRHEAHLRKCIDEGQAAIISIQRERDAGVAMLKLVAGFIPITVERFAEEVDGGRELLERWRIVEGPDE